MRKRYELQGEVGRGAGGTVYRARERATGRIVAIKVTPRAVEDGAAHARCTRWVDPMPHPAHENIVTVFECGTTEEGGYVVMDWVDGGNLRRHAEPANRLPLADIVSIVVRVADALAHAHDCHVVHGDVKPANILHDAASGAVKLTDFTYPALCESRSASFAIPATRAYMSPEQVCAAMVGPRSDQFSLGVTFYQLACGHLPFDSSSLPRLAFGIVNEKHRDVRVHEPALPAPLAAVIDRALDKRPAARYRSARELAAAVRSAGREVRQ